MKSALCIIAHPDDEAIAAGGTLALLTSSGIEVSIACATRGEGGELGEPPAATREELPQVREAELRCAADSLGIANVTFLDYVDPLIGPDEALFAFEADFDALAAQLNSLIRSRAPGLVMTHGAEGEYGHPAHILMHRAVRAAIAKMDAPPLFYTFGARVPGLQDPLWHQNEDAHLALDIRPWLDAKESAAQCHRTQHALMMRGTRSETLREALRTVEAYFRYVPPVEEGAAPHDAFADLLRAAGAWEPRHTPGG